MFSHRLAEKFFQSILNFEGKMFKSYLSSKEEHDYAPVDTQSEDGHVQIPIQSSKSVRKQAFIRAFIVLEAIHIFIFLILYAASHSFTLNVHPTHELDSCKYENCIWEKKLTTNRLFVVRLQ